MPDRTTEYAKKVLNGEITAGKYVKLACQRHLRDLDRQGTKEFPYVFDVDKANRVFRFAEKLKIAEGMEVKPLKLHDFQAFILGSLFGWIHKDTGYRRFRNSYIQMGRQNGKSILNAIIALYISTFDGYHYGQIYTAATKSDQAKIVLNEIVKFINADNDLKQFYKLKLYESTIEVLPTHSIIKALGRDTKTIDGFRPVLGIIDEYHAHKDNQIYKLLEDGTVNLPQALISVITTAGFNLNSPCKELYDYCINLLEGVFENDRQFVYIAQLDKDDDIWDENNWIKANPLVCATQQGIENIRTKASVAKEIGGEELRNFMTKTLNMWVEYQNNEYIDLEKWKQCASDMDLEDMRGKECYVGLDLSSGGDLTSIALEFPIDLDGQRKYFIHSHSFIPARRLEEHIKTDKAPYDVWLKEGLLTVTETLGGVKTDYKYIITYLKELIEKYNLKIKAIAYDPHNASAFLNDLESFGVDTVEIVQSAKSLNEATIDFKLEVEAGNIIYNRKNSLLTWSVANAKLIYNSFGECKIDKNYRNKRIDPIDAIIDAHKLAMLDKGKVTINDLITEDNLKKWGWV
ncbi:terminase [Caldanaerobacter subterraneus subsp. yonseiensis KB-1]|uniref:Terminase n=1 Tax=Caldanaerobacter subterraneus subsp. yonseiensis KB-1 TaxID=1388761 RepID=U5CQ63_CALSX|nr:terminase TerL endonuclease subunit [Caldanaerobacter subterraneus]ERM91899.1 terminase [Caldanaerobacter subterraneus subsp. yonseiensis KB-1]